jgi:hypothetical protein
MERLNCITEIIDRSIEFTNQVCIPDLSDDRAVRHRLSDSFAAGQSTGEASAQFQMDVRFAH